MLFLRFDDCSRNSRPFRTPPPTLGKLDKFGIKEIYLSKRGGEEWYLNSYDPKNDPQTGGEGPPTTFVHIDIGSRYQRPNSDEVKGVAVIGKSWH